MLIAPRLEEIISPSREGQVITDDEVALFYQSFGKGPAIIFANGIGVRYPGVIKQISVLQQHYQVICWDYRGMGQSVVKEGRGCDISMKRHARDLFIILDHLRIDRAILIGWCMGAQVILEAIREAPKRAAGLVVICGAAGRPLHSAYPLPLAEAAMELFDFFAEHPTAVQRVLDLAVLFPDLAFEIFSRVLFVGRNADRALFGAEVLSVAEVEKGLYLRTLLELVKHDASDVLPTVRCPSLVISAERDRVIPPHLVRRLADSISDAVYHEVEGGSHFALIEQPALINAWLLEFAARVYGRGV